MCGGRGLLRPEDKNLLRMSNPRARKFLPHTILRKRRKRKERNEIGKGFKGDNLAVLLRRRRQNSQ